MDTIAWRQLALLGIHLSNHQEGGAGEVRKVNVMKKSKPQILWSHLELFLNVEWAWRQTAWAPNASSADQVVGGEMGLIRGASLMQGLITREGCKLIKTDQEPVRWNGLDEHLNIKWAKQDTGREYHNYNHMIQQGTGAPIDFQSKMMLQAYSSLLHGKGSGNSFLKHGGKSVCKETKCQISCYKALMSL